MSSGIITMSAPSQPSRPASGEFNVDPLDPEVFSQDIHMSNFDEEFALLHTNSYPRGSTSTFPDKMRRTSTSDSAGFKAFQHSDSWKNYLAPPVGSPAAEGNAAEIQRPKSSLEFRSTEIEFGQNSTTQTNIFLSVVEDFGTKQAKSAPGSVIMSHRELEQPISQFAANSKAKDRRVTKAPRTADPSNVEIFVEQNLNEMAEAQIFEEKRMQIEHWMRRMSDSAATTNQSLGLGLQPLYRHDRPKSISDFGQFSFNGPTSPGRPDVDGFAPDEKVNFDTLNSVETSQNTDHHDAEHDNDASSIASTPPDYEGMKGHTAGPWKDDPKSFRGFPVSSKEQPISSYEAIIRFERMARDIETASRAATFGSRRMSTGNIEARLREMSFGPEGEKISVKRVHRGSSIFESIARLKRGASVLSSDGSRRHGSTPTSPDPNRSSVDTPFVEKVVNLARTLSKGRRPKQDAQTNTTSLIPSPEHLSVRPNGRARSKSDAGAMNKLRRMMPTVDTSGSGLAAVWKGHGGPPTIPVSPISPRPDSFEDATPSRNGSKRVSPSADTDNSWAASSLEKGVILDLEYFTRKTMEAFPNLDLAIVERIAGEQVKRYKTLVEYKKAHTEACNASPEGRCKNGALCRGVNTVSSPAASQRGHTPVPQSAATQASNIAGPDDDDLSITRDFPPGIPPPPVTNLPAEFECPICFQVKSIQKPSDWTKHVHEDVQPFTCTFKSCPGGKDPKSDSRRFKRKADWVRHENERHRRPEWWSCNLRDCQHVCYRRDNFVKHLVREHRMTDPQVKAVGVVDREEQLKVERIVKACHQVTDRRPADEPCRFCGDNKSTNWKKLTVHLAGHMERLALPILEHVLGALPPRKLSEAEERRKQGSVDKGHNVSSPARRPPTTYIATNPTSLPSSIPGYLSRRDTNSSSFSPLSSPVDPTPRIDLNHQPFVSHSFTSVPFTASHMPQVSSMPPQDQYPVLAPGLSSTVHMENTFTSMAPNPQLAADLQPRFTEDYQSSPYDLRLQQNNQQMYFNQSFAMQPSGFAPQPPQGHHEVYQDENQQQQHWQHQHQY